MVCENHFCIYWQAGCCCLGRISLDIQGLCQSCIYINPGEDALRREREKLLQQYAQADETDAGPKR